ncbi:MAG TPA: FimV/HubP family polar landmark protein [Steroidobacteraceae bacterium]|nr:FimV/HubP family polar landmark protein [Steroidobacteraceae bacterium]
MVAKRSIWALALLLALPSAAFALGLGDIRLLSPLNAPLDAEVELVDVAPDEMNTLQAQLASRDTFARYGLEWPAYLAGVQVRPVRTPDGREILKLRSTEAITEPFMTLLLEVSWAKGHLVREFTMLLDPPVYTPGKSALASAPVSAPATGGGVREGTIARSAAAPAAAAAPASPASQGEAPETPAASDPSPSTAAPSSRSAPAASSSDSAIGPAHVVQRGETLSGIASAAAGARANSARAESYMLAIYQQNPRAFERNMNILRSGAVLRIPDAAQAAQVSPSEAAAEIRRQYTAWRSAGGGAGGAASGGQPGRLKLVTPSESASVGATPGAPSGEVSRLQGQVHDLESQLSESKRLLELKNAELARMQSQLAAKQAPAVAPPPAAAAPPPVPPVEEKPPVAQATPPVEQPPAVQPPPPPVEEKPAEVAAKPPAPVVTEAKPAPAVPPAPSAGGSLIDTLLEYWWAIALVLVAVVAVIALRVVRAQRATQFDDSLGRLAAAGAEAVDAPQPSRGFAAGGGFAETPRREAPPVRAIEPVALDPNFVVEESGTHERPQLTSGATAARHVTADETISSETAINLDQGDPLAEADFHMAYGLYDQAADLIRIAIGREPSRRDLKLKLLEVFFVWGNRDPFLQTARELAETRDEAAPGEWEKILIMGKQLAPEDPLFSGGAVAGATAGGVDLDLEGGQSRVDFDLLGEPMGAGAGQTLDLDIGAAVGDHLGESPTGVTDQNAALASTGTTRQMTARLRQDLTTTAEFEAPTVEQPVFTPDETIRTPDRTIRQKLETALKQSTEQTAELALDDLGLDVGQVDTVDQLGLGAAGGEGPTLVAGLDDHSRQVMEDAEQRAKKEESGTTGAWQFDQDELLTQTTLAIPDASATSRLAALGARSVDVDVDLGSASGTHPSLGSGGVDLDVGTATGVHGANGGLDLDVGTATVPETAFAATQRLSSDDLALPDLEPVTMSEVGTKLDLARAYMDMGDPDGARNILEEVLAEGSAAQKQEAQRLMESLPG